MPKTKFQHVIFTFLMALFMVFSMICYNIAIAKNGMSNTIFLIAFQELALMFPIAFLFEFFFNHLIFLIAKFLLFFIEMVMFIMMNETVGLIVEQKMRLIVLKILYIKILKIGCVGEILDLLRRTPYFILVIK